jgi:hypothetical protein
MIATAKIVHTAIEFPESRVRDALTKLWAEEAIKRVDDPFAPDPKTIGTIYDLLPELDSLTIVRSFIILERILEMDVPVALVRPGGYHDHQQMLDDLLPKLRKLHAKR